PVRHVNGGARFVRSKSFRSPTSTGGVNETNTVPPRALGTLFPEPPSQVVILLRVNLHVTAGRFDGREWHTSLDHLLKEQDQVRLLERLGLAERLAGVLGLAAVVVFPERAGAGGGELRQADVLAVGLLGRNTAVNLS